MATFLYRFFDMMKLELPQADVAMNFKDMASIQDWAWEAVDVMQRAEIVKGYPDGTFQPQNDLTRAEAATMLFRCYGEVHVVVEGEGSVDGAGYYLWGSTVTLTATPAQGAALDGWYQKELLSKDNPYSFVLKETVDNLSCKFSEA